LRFDVEIGEPHPFSRERIDARCRCAACDAAAIDANLAVTQVVHQDEDDVGLAWRR
jgi:hypothetical protein